MLLCHEDLNNEQSVRKQLEDWNVDNIAIRAKSTATDQSVLKLVVLVRFGVGGGGVNGEEAENPGQTCVLADKKSVKTTY